MLTILRFPMERAGTPGHVPAVRGGASDIDLIFVVEARTTAAVPLMMSLISCGFPSPADDYLESTLDFNEWLGAHRPSIFVVRVKGDSMTGIGIYPGDFAVVDRAVTARDGLIIVGILDGEFTMKRFHLRDGRCWLHAENPAYRDIPITEDTAFEVWGVVRDCIRRMIQ